MLLAQRTGHDELALSGEETAGFLVAAQNVARHYSIETTQKTLDWIALAASAGQVFGTRAMAVIIKSNRKPQKRTADLHVLRPEQPQPAAQTGATYVPSVPQGPDDFADA